MNLEGSERPGTGHTVLVVEDDAAIAELMSYALVRDGFTAAIAGTCAAAKDHLEQADPDVILLDLKLPDGDGLDLLAWLKERGSHSEVIVMTAFRQEDKALRAYSLGAADFVCKPFKPRELVTRVRHVIDESRALRRAAGD